jgi:hypothetical protein
MSDPERPSRVVVTDAWTKEQQAKREAYDAKRRAWVRRVEHGDEAEEDEISATDGGRASEAAETGRARVPKGRGRRGGTIPDGRQARFTF